MSATNRGSARIANDLYSTPSWCVRRLVEKFPELLDLNITQNQSQRWLEPAAGKGNLIEELNGILPCKPQWDAMDIDDSHASLLVSLADTTICDFTHCSVRKEKYDVIITNPPYSLAMQFVEQARSFNPKYIIMLLRTNFLASESRSEFMKAHTPDLYVLPNRPCFIRGKSDNTEYSFFVWDRDKVPYTPGKLIMLDTTPIAERKLG